MNDERLNIDFARLCLAHGINTAKPGERHYREGWTCLPCPFCSGQAGNHLGFNPESNVFTCFRCGRHGKYEVLSALLGTTRKQAYDIAKTFATSEWAKLKLRKEETQRAKADKESVPTGLFELPGGTRMPERHRQYLLDRRFNPVRIARDWDLRFCDKVGRYAYRIVIPVTYKGKVVSFITRDVTDEAQDRYLACDVDVAIRHHKYCVYGIDKSPFLKTCVVVEGAPGVWRIGYGAGGTLGTGWTPEQAKILSRYGKTYIFFDPEEKQAGERAEKLSFMLSSYNSCKSYVIEGDGAKGRDTGELNKGEIKYVRKLLK